MAHFLSEAGVRFEREVPLGRYSLDFLLPDYAAVIEVDGDYWHRTRDPHPKEALILEKGWTLVRLDAGAMRRSGDLAMARALLACARARTASPTFEQSSAGPLPTTSRSRGTPPTSPRACSSTTAG